MENQGGRDIKPTDQLKEEHNAIKIMLQILQAVSEKLEAGQETNIEHLDMIIGFTRIFIDKCHHGKEEGILFPAMEEAGITKETSSIEVLLAEHNSSRNYVKRIRRGIAEYKKSVLNAAPRIVKNARGYIELLKQHIYKEDNVLYPMADRYLPAMAQGKLMAEFEELEEKVIGAGEYERLNTSLNILIDTYL